MWAQLSRRHPNARRLAVRSRKLYAPYRRQAGARIGKRVQLGLNRHCVDLPVLLESLGDHGGSVGRAVDDRTVGLARRRWMMRTQRVAARSPQSRDSFQAAGEPPSAVDLDG